MNQILNTNLNNNIKNNNLNTNFQKTQNSMYKNFFKIQFTISILVILIIFCFFVYHIYFINTKEQISKNLIGDYNIYKLYMDNQKEIENFEHNLFGIIEIPKINLYYPIFSVLTEENLKISPCKFYGTDLDDNTNICIAGHNYNNDMFFSKIFLLEIDDEIYIYDTLGHKYTYKIQKKYEVKADDLSPITDYDKNKRNLTLITCNNINKNRFIIKAINN